MGGLIRTILIILLLTLVGIGSSIVITDDLGNKVLAERKRGLEEGNARGYQAGFQDGIQAGYQEGSRFGYIMGSHGRDKSSRQEGFYFTFNPTYGEIRQLLAESETSSALEMGAYFEANGIRTAYVRCQIARPAPEGMVYVYELVAFETVDRGLIVIEPWSHRQVRVESGRGYSELNGFPIPDDDDTITKITFVW